MRAVQLIATGQPIEDREVARPEPDPGEVRVRIDVAGICHSNAHYRRGGQTLGPLPQTLVYEVAGVWMRWVWSSGAAWGPGGMYAPVHSRIKSAITPLHPHLQGSSACPTKHPSAPGSHPS